MPKADGAGGARQRRVTVVTATAARASDRGGTRPGTARAVDAARSAGSRRRACIIRRPVPLSPPPRMRASFRTRPPFGAASVSHVPLLAALALGAALPLALAPSPAAAQAAGRPAASLPVDRDAPARPAKGQEPWRIVPLPQSTLVYARDGSLIGEFGRQMRTTVSIRTLPKYVGNAFVAVEDKRFYQHNGVDVIGIAGALKDAVTGDVRGASTITQLLVGNMHPDVIDRRDRSPARKVREQRAALEMERHYTKEQVLEAFLNTIPFGHGWHGVDA